MFFKRNNLRRVTALTLSMTLVFSLMVGCGDKGNATADTTKSNSSGQKADPLPVSIITTYYTKSAPDEAGDLQKAIEKATNTKLNITWVPASNYTDKLNLTLASGQLPDLSLITTPHENIYRSYFSQGIFKELTNLYKNYKTLAAMPAESWENTKAPDGKNYLIPRPRPTDGISVFSFRADLFEAQGLKLPTTTDELYKDLVALKKAYPDYTGYVAATDQTGVTPSLEIQMLIETFTKANGNWKYENGKVIYADTLPEMKEGLAFVKKLYDEKLINEDWAILKDPKPVFNAGKWLASMDGTLVNNYDRQKEIVKIDPKAKVRAVSSLNGYVRKASGHYGGYGINSKVSDDKFKKLLQFMDDMNNPEVAADLNSYGIKDVHYKMENGTHVAIPDAVSRDMVGGDSFGQIGQVFDKYLRAGTTTAGIPQDFLDYNKKLVDEISKISTGGIMDVGITSATGDKLFPDYYKKSSDMKTKVILGKASMSEWDKYVADLKADATLNKSCEELAASYKAKTGK